MINEVGSPWQGLKVGEWAYYWFKTKDRAKVQGLGYRGVRKVKVSRVDDATLTLGDGSIFDRATGVSSERQELPEYHSTIIPKKILKPGRAKW